MEINDSFSGLRALFIRDMCLLTWTLFINQLLRGRSFSRCFELHSSCWFNIVLLIKALQNLHKGNLFLLLEIPGEHSNVAVGVFQVILLSMRRKK